MGMLEVTMHARLPAIWTNLMEIVQDQDPGHLPHQDDSLPLIKWIISLNGFPQSRWK